MKALLCISVALFCVSNASYSQIQFSEESVNLGCDNIVYTGQLGGGVSFYDFDNDGWDDLSIATKAGDPPRFFKNENGFFVELDLGIDYLAEGKTVQWVDFDNDGDLDIFLTSNSGVNALYENNGAMEFTNITLAAGLEVNNYISWGSSWGDFDNDGFLDLLVTSRDGSSGAPPSYLFRNNGDGTFENVTVSANLIQDNYLSFCAAFVDIDNDGDQDIFIANDKIDFPNLLYVNQGDNTFIEEAASANLDYYIDAMSTTIGDYNKDGFMDIYVTNTEAGNAFFMNNGDGTFTDIAPVNGTLMESVGWSAVFLDADNDADLDLYVSGSHSNDPPYLSAAFYENVGPESYVIPTGIGFENDEYYSFSNAMGDVDNDGFPEIVVSNSTPHNFNIWKNESPQTRNWLKVKLEGVVSNRQGIGSKIEVSTNGLSQYNYTLLGEGYLGQHSAYEFFGIGDETSIEYVKVTWPSGTIDVLEDPQINTAITIVEGSTILSNDDFGISIDDISVYPNPTSDWLNVAVPPNFGSGSLHLFDYLGNLLLDKKINSEGITLNISTLASGIYFVQIDNLIFSGVYKLIVK